MDLGIAGRVAVVTGGSPGIGAVTPEMLGAEGAGVMRGSRGAGLVGGVTGRSRVIGAGTVDMLECEGARVLRVSRGEGIDVKAPGAAEQIAEPAPGPVDLLVNNAGTSSARALAE